MWGPYGELSSSWRSLRPRFPGTHATRSFNASDDPSWWYLLLMPMLLPVRCAFLLYFLSLSSKSNREPKFGVWVWKNDFFHVHVVWLCWLYASPFILSHSCFHQSIQGINLIACTTEWTISNVKDDNILWKGLEVACQRRGEIPIIAARLVYSRLKEIIVKIYCKNTLHPIILLAPST